jgi:peptidase E
MYGDTAVKNTFFYYENTIPFVPDVSTYNSIDTYIDNMKKTFDGVEKDIQVKIDDRNKDLTKASKKIPAKQIIEKMMGDGYVTLSA